MNATAESVPQPRGHSARSAWGRRLAYVLAGLALLWLLAWLGVPPLLKWQLQKQASLALGRTVTLESVDFRPWSLELELRGLRVATAEGQGEQFSLKRAYVDAELHSLLRLAPVVDALVLEGPKLQLRHRGAGHYDIDDLLARWLQPQDTPAPLPRFAIFQIAVTDGAVDFIDEPVGLTHEVRDLDLRVPFLSNIGSRREAVTEPQLSFRLNGSAFDTRAASTPFLSTHKTEARLKLPGLDLQPYLPYWPQAWPLRPQGGTLALDLRLAFEQKDEAVVTLSGLLDLQGVRVDEVAAGQGSIPLLGWKSLQVEFDDSRPLQQQIRLKAVRWTEPELRLARERDGRLNLQRLASSMAPRPTPGQGRAGVTTAPSPDPDTSPWKVSLASLTLSSGKVQWQDRLATGQADIRLQNLNLQVDDLHWPDMKPLALKGSAESGKATVRVSGQAGLREGSLQVALQALPLSLARPYLAEVLNPELEGQLAAEAELAWSSPPESQNPSISVRLPRLDVNGLTVGPAKSPLAGWAALSLRDVLLQPDQRRLSLGQVVLDRPQIQLARDGQGRWMFEDWPAAPTPSASAKPPPSTQADQGQDAPWQLALGEFRLRGGNVNFSDSALAQAVRLELTGMDLNARSLAWPAVAGKPVALDARLRMATRRSVAEAGRLSFQGQLSLPVDSGRRAQPLRLRGALEAVDLPLHAVEPYVRDSLNLDLHRADTSFKGQFDLALPNDGPKLTLRGDAAVEDFRASTLAPAEDLLDWKTLSLRGLQVELEGGRLRELAIAETVLSDYFARVIVGPNGRINLQDLVRSSAAPASTALPPPAPAAPAPMAAADAPPLVRFGPIALVNGRVDFSDRFIQPNYSATLTELTGRLEAFDNRPQAGAPVLADLSLRGRAQGSATLDINGKLNPLARPLALDIQGTVRELELPPLSPYSVKYAGYGIERGKLSMDVRYQVNPDGQLNASNKLVLNQLSFGERVEGSEAPNLPLKLAVALLSDRQGVIDLDLPISGSINDPQFRLGPLIFRMVFNLIGKAVTSPFALIASAFGGGGEELNRVAFAPGAAQLNSASIERLDQVAKALESRPALQLTVTGHSDLEVERSAYQRQRLQALVQAEKRRRLARDGRAVEAAPDVSEAEYPELLKAVYRRAQITKPRNLLGIARDLPVPEAEALLMASIPVSEDAMRDLAVARAVAVKDHLTGRQVAAERLFLAAPVSHKGESTNWAPRAELKLALP
jgi:uncharacterized protein involved in outer membrane biogenesis